MARNEDMERRLRNWARWRLQRTAAAGHYAQVDLTEERVDGGGYDAPLVVPLSDAEAVQTEAAVQALEPELRETVVVVYVEGGQMRNKARRLGVAEATVYARVEQAQRRIAAWLVDRAEAARRERARVEALQASLRPGGMAGGFPT